jgi:hypothetical protein
MNAHGRRMIRTAQRCQKPSPSAARERGIGMRRRSTQWPTRLSTAGSRVMAASTATATTLIDPMAMERNAWMSTRNIPARATITVAPDRATARPEVARVIGTASATVRPRRSSSRKRVTTNRA